MIYIVYGTRAEIIKMSYFINRLKQKRIQFKLVDTGQQDTRIIREQLKIQEPDFYFGKSLREKWSKLPFAMAASLAVFWGLPIFGKLRRIFEKDARIVVIHGNSMSAALAISAAKFIIRRKVLLVHLESGLRGHKKESGFVDRFYKLADRNSDLLFTPYESCAKNLRKEKIKGKTVLTGDSYFDVIAKTESYKTELRPPEEKYILFNSIRSLDKPDKARQVVNAMTNSPIKIFAVLNLSIKHKLKKFDLLSKLESSDYVSVLDSIPYLDFLNFLKHSEGVITDSAGVQEECVYFNKPCLVTNDFIQIPEFVKFGIVRIGGCSKPKILDFLNEVSNNEGIYLSARSFKLNFVKGEATEMMIKELRQIA